MTVFNEGPSLAYHCEKPDRATPVLSEAPGFVGGEAEGSQSPIKKRGDCFASLLMTSMSLVGARQGDVAISHTKAGVCLT
jgi:hypothetical protein